ncbi:MAG TPA: Gfo/Idh/MocA family oxidoreductase, partial [Euzebyales bacterium]|nr:Gfo/Idh/MocA family oxidoreductase [Euzebyales bacterium]
HPDGVAHRFEAYDDLLACDEVDAVYIPLPNGLHERWVVAAAAAGKHVLCEKPLAITAAAVERMARACEDAGVVLMEAYMTPFHPRTRLLWQLLEEGRIGRVHHVSTEFGYPIADHGDHRLDPELGGGSLLDLGIYCLEPLLLAAGWQPDDPLPEVAAHADWAQPGADMTTTGWLAFPPDGRGASGVTGSFVTSFDIPDLQTLQVIGSDGMLRIERATYTAGPGAVDIAFMPGDGPAQVLHSDEGAQYQLMVEHFCDVVRGRAELERPPARSIALARLIDHIRDVSA